MIKRARPVAYAFAVSLLASTQAFAWSESKFSGTESDNGNVTNTNESGYSNSGSGYASDNTAEVSSPSTAYRLVEIAKQDARTYIGSGVAGAGLIKAYQSYLEVNKDSELSLEEYALALIK